MSLAEPNVDFVDCSEYKNDLDVISRFPFKLKIDPHPLDNDFSYVRTYPENNQSIREIYIYHESVVPPSFVCLHNLRDLQVDGTPFHKSSFLRSVAHTQHGKSLF